MRRFMLVVGLLASCGAGCSNIRGPIETRQLPRADAPGYSIGEQERRGRERLSITEDDWRIGPKGYIDRPSPTGR
ncbi:MAG TPA: hypothetical protein VM529_11355 [Gemmata sp.]|jgi:hypothetical protein|nr:hypothetical protein [Gemmata sp.]